MFDRRRASLHVAGSPTRTHCSPLALPLSPCRSHPLLVKGALQLDRGAVALDTRPLLRAGLAAYLVLLHLLALLF